MTDRALAPVPSEPAAPAPAPAPEQWIIEPRGRTLKSRISEIWTFRRLFIYFGRRAVQRLYRNTLLGRAWIFIRPLFPLFIRTIVFGGVLQIGTPGGIPYFLFLLVGSAIWDVFASCLMWATRSLQLNRGFLGRMYFPRVIVPAATMAVAFVNFLIMMGVFVTALVYYYVSEGRLYAAPPAHLPWALAALVLSTTLALGIGLWTAPMNAQYRDVRFTLVYILEFWALLTPVLYPLSAVPERYHWIVFLNPLSGVVQAFKWGLLGIEPVDPRILAVNAGLVVLVLLSGLWFFARIEGQAVDRI